MKTDLVMRSSNIENVFNCNSENVFSCNTADVFKRVGKEHGKYNLYTLACDFVYRDVYECVHGMISNESVR